MAKLDMKSELIAQNKSKVAYQHDLITDIIDRNHAHLHEFNVLSNDIQRDELIDNKIHAMKESKARRELFTVLNIKGCITPSSIK
jgi:hypothetical protein